jgi:hypothetical protein
MQIPPDASLDVEEGTELLAKWEWLVAWALLEYDFSEACELHHNSMPEQGWSLYFESFARACFAKRERSIEWHHGSEHGQTPQRTPAYEIDSPSCIAGGAWAMERALTDQARLLAHWLDRRHQRPSRYAHAARRALDELLPTSAAPFVAVHWRRGDVFLPNNPTQRGWELPNLLRLAREHAWACLSEWTGTGANATSSGLGLYVMHDTRIDDAQIEWNGLIPRPDAAGLLGEAYVGSIDGLLLDQEIALQSTLFVGNAASGVSQWVFHRRRAAGKYSLEISSDGASLVQLASERGVGRACGHVKCGHACPGAARVLAVS